MLPRFITQLLVSKEGLHSTQLLELGVGITTITTITTTRAYSAKKRNLTTHYHTQVSNRTLQRASAI